MAYSTPPNLYKIVASFSGIENGWTERYFLNTATLATALTTAQAGLALRMNVLPEVCALKYARLILLGKPPANSARRTSAMIPPAPLAKLLFPTGPCPSTYPIPGAYPGGTWTPGTPGTYTPATHEQVYPQNDDDALLLRGESTSGGLTHPWMHGIPDIKIEGNDLATPLVYATAPDASAPYTLIKNSSDVIQVSSTILPIDWGVLLANWIYWLQTSSCFWTEGPSTSQPNYVDTWRAYYLERVGERKTGKVFGLRPGVAFRR